MSSAFNTPKYREDLSHVQFPQFDLPPLRQGLLQSQDNSTLLSLMNGEPLITADEKPIQKPAFLFGDSINEDSQPKAKKESRLFGQGDNYYYLPDMSRGLSLSSYSHASYPRVMSWDLTPSTQAKAGRIYHKYGPQKKNIFYSSTDKNSSHLRGLRPSRVPAEDSSLMMPVRMPIFANLYAEAAGIYPSIAPRLLGLMHPDNRLWNQLSVWFLNGFSSQLTALGLYDAIYATSLGIPAHSNLFLALVERYNAKTGTFVTPHGELGFALQEMHFISHLPIGDFPYEEYVPTEAELASLAEENHRMVEVFDELLCHFLICTLLPKKGTPGTCYTSKWMMYLFYGHDLETKVYEHSDLNPGPFEPFDDYSILDLMGRTECPDNVLEADYGNIAAGTPVASFIRFAGKPMSKEATIAGFLSLWLRKFVIPGASAVDRIHRGVIFAAVRLVFGHKMDLLSAMVSRLNAGLREFTSSLMAKPTDRKEFPRTEMPLTYLFGWLIMHHTQLISPGLQDSGDFISRYSRSKWHITSLADCRKVLNKGSDWKFYCIFPPQKYNGSSNLFRDTEIKSLQPPPTVFTWLTMIRPSHLVYRSENMCFLEPYLPSRFARQFGYDQLHVGNATTCLQATGLLVDGARAWRYYHHRGTQVLFTMPASSLESGPQILGTYANFYTSANTFFEGYSFIDSFVGPQRAHAGDPSTVELKEKEDNMPADKPLELSKGFADEVHGSMYLNPKRRRASSPRREGKKKKKRSPSPLPDRVETLPLTTASPEIIVEEPTAMTTSKKKKKVLVEPSTSPAPTTSAVGATPSPAKSRALSQPTPTSLCGVVDTPKSPIKKQTKRKLLKSVVVKEKRVSSPVSVPKLPSPTPSSPIQEPAASGIISDTLNILEIEPLAVCIEIPCSPEPVKKAQTDVGLQSPMPCVPISPIIEEQTAEECATAVSSKPTNEEIIEALQDIVFYDTPVAEDLARMDDMTEEENRPEAALTSEKDAAVDVSTSSLQPLVVETDKHGGESSSQAEAAPMRSHTGGSGAGSSHMGSPVPVSVMQRLREERDTDRISTPYIPATAATAVFTQATAGSSSSTPLASRSADIMLLARSSGEARGVAEIAATPEAASLLGGLVNTHTQMFFQTLQSLVRLAIEKNFNYDFVQRSALHIVESIHTFGNHEVANALRQIVSELQEPIQAYQDLIRGNISRQIDAECEVISREYDERRSELDNAVTAFTIQSGELESAIMELNSTFDLLKEENERKNKEIADGEAEIARIRATIEASRRDQNTILESQQKVQTELETLNQQRDVILAQRNEEISRQALFLQPLAPEHRRDLARERVLATRVERAEMLKKIILDLSTPPPQ